MTLKPSEIDLTKGFLSTFGKAEVEESAERLTRFLIGKAKDSGEDKWPVFTFIQLHDWYVQNKFNPDEMLFGLIGPWLDDGNWEVITPPIYIVHWGSWIVVTEEFLRRIRRNTLKGRK